MLGSKERPRPEPTCMSGDQMGQPSSFQSTTSSMAYTPSSPSRLRECQTYDYDTSSPQRHTIAAYLSGLRKQRVERPTGSRPPPPSRFDSIKRNTGVAPIPDAQSTTDKRPSLQTSTSMPVMKPSRPSQQQHASTSSVRSPFAGRPLVQPPHQNEPRATSPARVEEPQPTVRRTPSMTYTERGSRWMEKQEAHSIRQAMEDMALQEERKLHEAARDEAAELVWRHQNPQATQGNRDSSVRPNPDLKKDYRSHLRKGSYRRSVDQDTLMLLQQRSESRSSSSGSGGDPAGGQPETNTSIDARDIKTRNPANRKISPPAMNVSVPKTRTPSGPSYAGLAEAVANDIAKAHRRSSSGGSSRRILSGEKKLFMHPDDKIWEDPDEEATPNKRMTSKSTIMEEESTQTADVEPRNQTPPQQSQQTQPTYVRKNPFARVRTQAAKLERSQSDSSVVSETSPRQQHSRVEIQRNPPSQSRNPFYVSNVTLPPTPPPAPAASDDEVAPKDATPTRDGREIRGDDIRAATSKSRSDYSSKLPRPTVVSDKPGRPIVSFRDDWRPKEVVMESMGAASRRSDSAEQTRESLPAASSSTWSASAPPVVFDAPPSPVHEMSQPSIPKISLPDEPVQRGIPTINLPDDNPAVPSISIQSEDDHLRSTNRPRPSMPRINVSAPSINVQGPTSPSASSPSNTRASPHRAATSPTSPNKSTPHYSPSSASFPRNSGALCAHCALPIAGRILSASGERFHPSCFKCHECGTNLELVAFYPEPESKRAERLEASRNDASDPSNADMRDFDEADSDPSPRFYCHLDFHELFSPRCKSCRTPIEGEVIVACGAEWHVGHFFCAQCGDPFDSSMPFVEKDGYAWCVGCHTNRYSAKCRKCRKPVVETVVKALGAEWHQACFVCAECNGEFTDGRFFLRGDEQDPVCVACEERRLKA